MTHLVTQRLSVDALLAEVQGPERGGTCVFLGTVRSDDDVTGIEYSAYDDMALGEITRILNEAQVRWPDARVTLRHPASEIGKHTSELQSPYDLVCRLLL